MTENFRIKTECAVCPTKIWRLEGTRLKKTEEYHEIKVRLNDLSNMTVGVCSKHIKLDKTGLTLMTEKIHQGWLEEVALGIGNEGWVRNKGTSLEVVGVNT